MAGRPDELERFKRINLTEYAATLGYRLDRRASSRNSAVMVHPGGDKLIVARGEDGHWIYFSVRDDADNGSIIDFVQRRESGTLGDVRKILRPWIGGNPPAGVARPAPESFTADLAPIRRDLLAVRARYEQTWPIDGHHPYLEDVRNISPHVLTDPLFSDRVRTDAHGAAIFPHYNARDGLCGWEIKNKSEKGTFTGFAKGGIKGLWFSRVETADCRRLVIAETAIDALSYASLNYQPGTRYVSTAGELNPDQPILLQRMMEKLPDCAKVVLAVDNDAGGATLGGRIDAIFASVNRPALTLAHDRPPRAGDDWNDVLRATPGTAAGPALRPRPPR